MVRRRREKGYVLLVALFVLLVAMTATMLISQGLNRRFAAYRGEVRDVQLRALLDAGLAKTLSWLWADPDYRPDSLAEPFGDGTVAVRVRKISGLEVEVTVQATYSGPGRAVQARVKIDRNVSPKPPRVLRWSFVPYEEDFQLGGGRGGF